MHIFAAERPEIATGVKALLLDGSAIPRAYVVPMSTGVYRVLVMLHKYDKHGGYTYYHVDLSPTSLGQFFSDYMEDPEATLAVYFNWRAQVPTRPQAAQPPRPSPVSGSAQQAAKQLVDDLL